MKKSSDNKSRLVQQGKLVLAVLMVSMMFATFAYYKTGSIKIAGIVIAVFVSLLSIMYSVSLAARLKELGKPMSVLIAVLTVGTLAVPLLTYIAEGIAGVTIGCVFVIALMYLNENALSYNDDQKGRSE